MSGPWASSSADQARSPQGQAPGMSLTITGSSQRFGSPTAVGTRRIAVLVTTLAFLEIGNSGVVAALNTSTAIPAGVWLEFEVIPGSYVAIIGTGGTAYLRELGVPA